MEKESEADLENLITLLERKKNHKRYMSMPPKNERICFIIKDYVYHQQSDNKNKYFILDLIKFTDMNKEEIRIGYYIKGKKGNMKGKWAWGQYCPLISKKDLKTLLNKAKKKGLI